MSKVRFALVDLLMYVGLAALVAAVLAPMFQNQSGGGLITKVAISADGSTAAALFGDGNVRIWNAADGNRLAELETGPVENFALSANGKMLATTGFAGPKGYGIQLWSIATGKRLRALPAAPTAEIVFAPSGGRMAWLAHSGAVELYEPPLESSAASALASPPALAPPTQWTSPVFSPDGALLAIRDENNQILLFDVAARKLQATLKIDRKALGAMAFSPDGRRLALLSFLPFVPGDDAGARFLAGLKTSFIEFEAQGKQGSGWDFSKATRRQHNLDDLATFGHSVAFLPDGQTLAAAGGNTAALVETDTGKMRNLNVNGFIACVNSGGSVIVTSDLYRVDLYGLPDGVLRRTLWSSPLGVSPAATFSLGIAIGAHFCRRRLRLGLTGLFGT